MNKLLLTLSGALFLTNVQASQTQSYEFEVVKMDLESQICIMAAQKGIKAAKTLASENGIFLSAYKNDFYCNSIPLNRFVKQYGNEVSAVKSDTDLQIELFSADKNLESDLCVKAVKTGIEAVKTEHKNVDSLRCNGKSIKKFVKKYSEKSAI
ncbi:hypothetical protein [Pseudoalteromonas denitrificans]|uniref:Exonuclease III n=1 Tax=Pseudoalteromonas denitrificans DSM 6059 TaxID=1123010 RepID=A0A1I1GUP4_9GAMM|nr:hypothetical protein [Pseudoalteromonas denitrificans]SFC13568.1 hypothetical protein SAMN02745724_00985 [Pseudoalteromonas denitrificans DSM 6059]